ncbi:MAG TPA: aromatic amino acid lyase, partial [Bacteroidota bacterium]|nr:aromatic amino acid lyase [Bacteroidota bacterium]
MKSLSLDGERLTLGQLADIAYNRSKVELSSIAKQKIDRARGVVDAWLKSGETIYGVTTGFGEFSNV